MIGILFVCHGNICRSPMAEFVLKRQVRELGDEARARLEKTAAGSGKASADPEDLFLIESAATSAEELGNPVYPPARAKLAEHGISCKGKTARRITRADYDRFDLIIGMDAENDRNLKRLFPEDSGRKIRMMMDYTDRPGPVADPWYTGDFEATWRDVNEGCRGLLRALIASKEAAGRTSRLLHDLDGGQADR